MIFMQEGAWKIVAKLNSKVFQFLAQFKFNGIFKKSLKSDI